MLWTHYKQRKEEKTEGRLQSRMVGCIFNFHQYRRKSAWEQFTALFWLVKRAWSLPNIGYYCLFFFFSNSELDFNTKSQNSLNTPPCKTVQWSYLNTTFTNSGKGNQIVPKWDQSLFLCPPNPLNARGPRHMHRAMQPGPGQRGCRRDRGAGGYTGKRSQDYRWHRPPGFPFPRWSMALYYSRC